jgi:hypothetical protein
LWPIARTQVWIFQTPPPTADSRQRPHPHHDDYNCITTTINHDFDVTTLVAIATTTPMGMQMPSLPYGKPRHHQQSAVFFTTKDATTQTADPIISLLSTDRPQKLSAVALHTITAVVSVSSCTAVAIFDVGSAIVVAMVSTVLAAANCLRLLQR